MPSLIYTSCCFKCIIPTYVAQQIARWSEKSCSAPAMGSARGSAAMLLQHKPAEGWQCVYVNRLLCQFPAKKKAASDALTAGQIQSCFYRQRENPLTVAVLGIICSPWVMWTTRWKKKKKKKMEAHKGKEKRRQYNHCFPLCAMSVLNNSVTKRLWSNNLYQSGKEMSYNKWCPETPLFHDPN